MEYDHMAELGFAEETQFICSDHVFLTRSNHVRDLCARYIKNGGRLYDVLARYDALSLYALGRDTANAGSVNRLVVSAGPCSASARRNRLIPINNKQRRNLL